MGRKLRAINHKDIHIHTYTYTKRREPHGGGLDLRLQDLHDRVSLKLHVAGAARRMVVATCREAVSQSVSLQLTVYCRCPPPPPPAAPPRAHTTLTPLRVRYAVRGTLRLPALTSRGPARSGSGARSGHRLIAVKAKSTLRIEVLMAMRPAGHPSVASAAGRPRRASGR